MPALRVARTRKNDDAIQAYEKKNQLLQQIDQLLLDTANEKEKENILSVIKVEDRNTNSPPPAPIKDKYNPDGIYDIVTVAEDPYFLGLTLTPWQRLALKICYSGTPGNIHLKINNERSENGCENCIWSSNRVREELQIDAIKAGAIVVPKSYLPIENSPCLICTRFCKESMEIKKKYLIDTAATVQKEENIKERFKSEIQDNYYTEQDMLDFDLSPEVKQQVESKLGHSFQEIIFVFGRRSGKAVSLDTPIITTDGWKTMGELKVGDYVFSDNGLPTKIIATSEIITDEDTYEMSFSNGDKIIAGANHEWGTYTKAQRKNASRGKYYKEPQMQIFTTKQIYDTLRVGKPRFLKNKDKNTYRTKPTQESNHAIKITSPLQYIEQKYDLLIEPYLLGCWIGDGSSNCGQITTLDTEIIDTIQSYGYKCSQLKNKMLWGIGSDKNNIPLIKKIRKLNIYKNKHIPNEYMYSSYENRLELLRGLLDTDGFIDPIKCTIEFCNTNKLLAEQVYELVCSLGIKATFNIGNATLNGRFISKKYRVCFTPPYNIKVFKLKRKLQYQKEKQKSDIGRIFIRDVKKLDNPVPLKCIQVESASHMYLCGKTMIPTHNSLLTAIISLYEVHRLIGMIHPQKRFELMPFDVIRIINVAKSAQMAKEAIFDKTRPLAQTSPYYSKYIGKAPTQDEIFFLTEHDIKENERRQQAGIDPLPGTIQLRSGHSESTTMLGLTCYLIIVDEMAAMASAGDISPDETMYNLLRPSIANFGTEGKMVCISNPLGPFGKFYELYKTSFDSHDLLMLQLPTWKVNPTVEKSFLEAEKIKDPVVYSMQYGAEFGSTGSSPWLDKEFIFESFTAGKNKTRMERGIDGITYFMHVDPAYSSDYYTLAIVHSEPTADIGPDGKNLLKIIVDHIHYFAPQGPGKPVNIDEVDEYIIKLAQKFKFGMVSYDHYWGSQASVHKMKNYGLDVRITPFTGGYKESIYAELQNMFTSGRIEFYFLNSTVIKKGEAINLDEASMARSQFVGLQRKFKNNKYKIEALIGSYDDIPDCVAGAAYQAVHYKTVGKLPKTVSFYTGGYFK